MRSRKGFTLIELLVTISVIGVVLALVGPFGMEQLERTRRLSDRQSLEQLVAHEQRTSFLTASATELSFSGRSLTISSSDGHQSEIEFGELFFPPQVIVIDPHGMPSAETLNFNSGTSNLQLELSQQVGF